jgi:hypothetical protein
MGNHLVCVGGYSFFFFSSSLSSSVFFPTVEPRVSLKFDEFPFFFYATTPFLYVRVCARMYCEDCTLFHIHPTIPHAAVSCVQLLLQLPTSSLISFHKRESWLSLPPHKKITSPLSFSISCSLKRKVLTYAGHLQAQRFFFFLPSNFFYQ